VLASSRVSEAVISNVRRQYAPGHLEMLRDVAETFPALPDASRYESAWIWHCRFRSLSGLGRLTNLRKLEVAGYPDASLDPLRTLNQLEHLSMVHLPAVNSLAPLSGLTGLRRLTLAALPAHDPAWTPVEVESLTPLGSLPALEEVNLFGVRPADRSLEVLWGIPTLRRLRLVDYPTNKRTSVSRRMVMPVVSVHTRRGHRRMVHRAHVNSSASQEGPRYADGDPTGAGPGEGVPVPVSC